MKLIRTKHKNKLVTYQSPKLNEAGVKHGFSTRIGGASKGKCASLNLDLRNKNSDKDFNLAISENFRRFRAALDIQSIARVELNQVHGKEVFHVAGKPTTPANAPKADSAIYDKPDRLLAVRTADCAPILLASKDGKIVGAIHAGWRGIVAGIVPETIKKISEDFAVNPENLIAAVGPCISLPYFEVGQEVADEFDNAGLSEAVANSANQLYYRREDGSITGKVLTKPHIDLHQATLLQLKESGIKEENIDSDQLCTYSDSKEFFSHRRDNGQTGRMAAVIVAK